MLLIVDGNSLGHRYNEGMKLSSGSMPTQAIYGIVKCMHQFVVMKPDIRIAFVWDSRSSNETRREVYSEYKASRSDEVKNAKKNDKFLEMKEQYNIQRPFISLILTKLGVHQYYAEGHEADDVAAYMVRALKNNDKIVLLTSDTDWMQLVDVNVSWSDPRANKIVTLENFSQMTDYEHPEDYLEAKIIMGDSTDDIPPIASRSVGKGRAPEFIRKFGGFEEFVETVKRGDYKPVYQWERNLLTDEAYRNYERNKLLIDLRNNEYSGMKVRKIEGSYNKEELREQFNLLSFRSFNNEDFYKSFERWNNGKR